MTALFGHDIIQAVVGADESSIQAIDMVASRSETEEQLGNGYEVKEYGDVGGQDDGKIDIIKLSLKFQTGKLEKTFKKGAPISMLVAFVAATLIEQDRDYLGKRFDILFGYPIQNLKVVAQKYVADKIKDDPTISESDITFEDIGLVGMSCQVKLY